MRGKLAVRGELNLCDMAENHLGRCKDARLRESLE